MLSRQSSRSWARDVWGRFFSSIKLSPWRRSSPGEFSPKETRRNAGKAQSATSSVFVVGSLGNPNKTCKCEIWMICKNIPLGLRLKCNSRSMIQRKSKNKKWLIIKNSRSLVMQCNVTMIITMIIEIIITHPGSLFQLCCLSSSRILKRITQFMKKIGF